MMFDSAEQAGARMAALAASMSGLTRVELSHRLVEGMAAFAGHPTYRHVQRGSLDWGDPTSHFELAMGEHTGTHLDAPLHIVDGGHDVTTFAYVLTRAAVLRPLEREGNVGIEDLRRFECAAGPVEAGDSVLVDHGWAARWGDSGFMRRWPSVDVDLASELVERGVVLIAADTPSPDAAGCDRTFPVHEVVLGSGVFIGENFANLPQLGDWCLLNLIPLPISGGTGSPVRAIASTGPAAENI
ncbi:hypothetical protein CH262_19785 [Rhodococcus sp. 05-2255-1e]|uniref:cyclase family protein n=1 Tax=Rhodococcus sp. 05-2255-1e TaxID=2022495 RepID=UPI000B9C1947|nr:cyclase family protein [Rhodococcus sp. 05-2255-1e]OZE21572.1 hypothetical protein CH262_19785 [Rhodococcus sp. 05-2255-1e]